MSKRVLLVGSIVGCLVSNGALVAAPSSASATAENVWSPSDAKPQELKGPKEPKPPKSPPPRSQQKPGNGNNGVGNGEDPQPPGNPPVNDGPGSSPGSPGNKGGANK